MLPVKKVYAVYTSHLARDDKHFWNGFGPTDPNQLLVCFAHGMMLNVADLQLGQAL